MSHVEMNDHVIEEYLAHPHALAAEPIAVRDPMDVAVDWPGVEERIHDGILWEHAQARAKDAAVEVVTVRQHCLHPVPDRMIIGLWPDLLQGHQIISTGGQQTSNRIDSGVPVGGH